VGSIDLHVHSSASDGSLSPAELVSAAAERGVTLLALTDHDITDGLPEAEAAAAEAGVTFVPGVELSAECEGREVHILGYFIRCGDPGLEAVLSELRARRRRRNAGILERLRSLGAPVDPSRLEAIAEGGSVGRPHIACALVEAGHVSSQQEAFSRYLAAGRPAFVPRALLDLREACEVVRQAGGLSVLAHAAKLGSLATIEHMVAAGCAGVEAYHSDHSLAECARLVAFARERSLLVTGGSDSHGPRSPRPIPIGGLAIPEWVGEELLARAPGWWESAP